MSDLFTGIPRTAPDSWAGWTVAVLLTFGTLFAAATPPFQVPDEPEHFYKAFALSEGRLLPLRVAGQSGDFLPGAVPRVARALVRDLPFHGERRISVAEIRAQFGESVRPRDPAFVPLMTSAYSPLVYLPQAAAIAGARIFSDSVLVLFYAGRLANVLVSALLFGLAVRRTPVAKPLFFVLAATPMALFQSASLSADAPTNAFAFFFIATLLRRALAPSPSGESAWELVGLSLLLGLTKPGFVWLPALAWLEPVSVRRRVALTALGTGACLAAMLAWSLAVRSVYPPLGGSASTLAQVHDLLAHPLGFAGMALSYYARQAPILANQYIGKLGWVDTRLPAALVVAIALVLVGVAATCGCTGPRLSRGQRGVLAAVLVGSLVWITVLLYVFVTPPGARTIEGTQGRHFLPLGPVAFLLLYNSRLCVDWNRRRGALAGWVSFSLAVSLVVLARRFYG